MEDFIYKVAEAVILETEDVEVILYNASLPESFTVVMNSGKKYLITVTEI